AEAGAALTALVRQGDCDTPTLDRALTAMDEAGAGEAALTVLDQALPTLAEPEAVAERWARLWLRLRPRPAAAGRLAALLGKGVPAGAAATRHWIARLAETGATATDDLLALLREHGRAIARDERCWGEAGRALLRLAGPEAAATWLGDWQNRPKAAPWALAAAAEVLRRLGRDADANAAARAALARGEDPTSWQLRLWLAADAALAGNPSGADAVRTAAVGSDPYWSELRTLAQAALLVAVPEPDPGRAWDALEAVWRDHGAAIKAGREAPELARLRSAVAERIAGVQGGMMAGIRARWLGRGGGRDDG
ncbi:MAG: hypothetical protein L6R48_25360, partial [Planctomycetes bacterium]|nr:hypothetical protein [Planctomycetota bacterium]